MAVIGKIQTEGIVQVGDKTRIKVKGTFVTPDEGSITLLRVDPDTTGTFYDVTSNKYLDFAYLTAGDTTVSLEVTTDSSAAQVFTSTISVITETEDQLFSTDEEIIAHEHDILDFLPKGRFSFKDKHRAAQDRILGYLDEKQIWDCDNNRLTKAAIIDNDEVNDWSKFMVLELIFRDASNAIDDIFFDKAEFYRNMMVEARNRACLRLDLDGDGEIKCDDKVHLYTTTMVRR